MNKTKGARIYRAPKKLHIQSPERLHVVFQNGDCLHFSGGEVSDVSLTLCDRLLKWKDLFCPVCCEGVIRLTPFPRPPRYDETFLYSGEAYERDRRAYIKERLLGGEDTVVRIRLFDENNWSETVFGDIVCREEGDALLLCFCPHPRFGASNGDRFYLRMCDVEQERIDRISLYHENCDRFRLLSDEIKAIRLYFSETLAWGSDGYHREVIGGTLLFKLDPCWHRSGDDGIYLEEGEYCVGHLISRLCGYGGETDICALAITYRNMEEEYVNVREMDVSVDAEDEDFFVSGCAALRSDGCVSITFGKLPDKPHA